MTPTGSVTGSNIVNNGQYAVHLTSINESETVIDATNNWWGVTDSASIENLVYHNADSSIYPTLDFIPFAYNQFEIDTDATGFQEYSIEIIPDAFTLKQNYPNPFNSGTLIEYSVTSKSHITINIFNILGQRIKTLLDEQMPVGKYTINWDGNDYQGNRVASGIYLCQLNSGDFLQSKKMLLIK